MSLVLRARSSAASGRSSLCFDPKLRHGLSEPYRNATRKLRAADDTEFRSPYRAPYPFMC